MYKDRYGRSETQFNLNSAKVLDKKGLAKLTDLTEFSTNTTHQLRIKIIHTKRRNVYVDRERKINGIV